MLPALLLASLLFVPHHDPNETPAKPQAPRFTTSRPKPILLPLPGEEDAFFFVIFGDRTGGPREGVQVLAEAVADVNLLAPDLVMTVGDLVQGYNAEREWLREMGEFKGIMARLDCPWFPVAGNHDVYWRGEGAKPAGENEPLFEQHFGPLWYAFRHKSAWFIALYSDEGDPATGLKSFSEPKAQRISPEQLAWLVETLAKAREAEHVFVFLHHPRWLGGGYGDDWENVHSALVKAGNVKAVFAGHIHRMRYDGSRDGIEYFALATVGGAQEGWAAEAGYLHQYHVVTVRKQQVAVAAFPVGAAMDARAITGEASMEIEKLTKELAPRWSAPAAFQADESIAAELVLTLVNPAKRAIEVTLAPASADSRWSFAPEHAHFTLGPGASRDTRVQLARAAGAFDAAFRTPELALSIDWLGEGLRVPLPERRLPIPLDAKLLPLPTAGGEERALTLDGRADCLAIESARLALPDGPFTIEGWLRADSFPERAGFMNKTESSDYGLFVDRGRPAFLVHTGRDYVGATAKEPILQPGKWHHLAGVFDGSEARLYVDGALVAAARGAGKRKQNGLPLLIGADVGSGGTGNSFLPGTIDEVRVSTGARYAGERFEPARRFETDEQTLLLLHLDGAFGPWMADASGHGTHADVRGKPKVVEAGR